MTTPLKLSIFSSHTKMAVLQSLIVLIILLSTPPLTRTTPLPYNNNNNNNQQPQQLSSSAATTLSCRDTRIKPTFTNETFCSLNNSQKVLTCCYGKNNKRGDFIQSPFKTSMETVLNSKFVEMRRVLLDGAGRVDGIICPHHPNISSLLQTTASSLRKLAEINWTDLFDLRNTNLECRVKIARAFLCGKSSHDDGGEDGCAPTQSSSSSTTPPSVLSTPICPTHCTTLLHHCFSKLQSTLHSPWKQAVSFVKTAVRLLITESSKCDGIKKEENWLDSFSGGYLGGIREGAVLWGDNTNSNTGNSWVELGVCPQQSNKMVPCFSGEFGMEGLPILSVATTPTNNNNNKNSFRTVSEVSLEYEGRLAVAKEVLLGGVVKELFPFWPSTTNSQDNHTPLEEEDPTNADSSIEYTDSSSSEEYFDDDEDFNSSGSGSHDDLEEPFNTNPRNPLTTDDEDLLGYDDSGSGHHGHEENENQDLGNNEDSNSNIVLVDVDATSNSNNELDTVVKGISNRNNINSYIVLIGSLIFIVFR